MLLLKTIAPWLYLLKNYIVIDDIHFELPLDVAPVEIKVLCIARHE